MFNWDKLIAFFFDLLKKFFQSRYIGIPQLTLPHPEEARDYTRTIENTSIPATMDLWYLFYQVPSQYLSFWYEVQITLVENLYVLTNNHLRKVPAATNAELRTMKLDPQWANPGILAHEFSHISYSILTTKQKREFEITFMSLLATDKLLKFAYEQKLYMQSSYVEAHADCYRYLGNKMPEDMKRFYPKLF